MSARGIFRFARMVLRKLHSVSLRSVGHHTLTEYSVQHPHKLFPRKSPEAVYVGAANFFSSWIACIPGTQGRLRTHMDRTIFSMIQLMRAYQVPGSTNENLKTIWLEWVCGNTFLGALQIFQWEIDDALCAYVDFFYAMHMNDIASKLPGKYELF